MLIKILTHTPLYVWAILALLIYRGVIAARDREVGIRKLLIIPFMMLALSLQGVLARFGLDMLPFVAWVLGTAGTTLLIWKFGRERISAGSTAGAVRVQGSWAPMAMMMAIFFAKYAVAVAMAIQAQAAQNALFAATVCTLFGVFSGYFAGRLACDLRFYRTLRSQGPAHQYAVAAA
jgi:hypothetical protein